MLAEDRPYVICHKNLEFSAFTFKPCIHFDFVTFSSILIEAQ